MPVGEQVRAVRRVGGEPGRVERGGGRDVAGLVGGGAQRQRPAHAVAGDADRAVGDLVVGSAGSRGRRPRRASPLGGERLHPRDRSLEQRAAGVRVLQRRGVDQRRPALPVEHVRDQDDVPLRGDPVGHLLEPRPRTEGVHVEEHRRGGCPRPRGRRGRRRRCRRGSGCRWSRCAGTCRRVCHRDHSGLHAAFTVRG